MNFDTVVDGVGGWLLSPRTYDLVLAPALADYQVERSAHRRTGWAGRFAVLAALSGALRMEASINAASFFALALLPFCYDIVLLVMFHEFFDVAKGMQFIGAMIVVMSVVPVIVVCWPERRVARPLD